VATTNLRSIPTGRQGRWNENERQELRAITDEVARWVDDAHSVCPIEPRSTAPATMLLTGSAARVVIVRHDGEVGWAHNASSSRRQSVPELHCAAETILPSISTDDDKALASLTTQAAAALGEAKAIVGARRFFSGSKKREAGTGAADYLRSLPRMGTGVGSAAAYSTALAPEAHGGSPGCSRVRRPGRLGRAKWSHRRLGRIPGAALRQP